MAPRGVHTGTVVSLFPLAAATRVPQLFPFFLEQRTRIQKWPSRVRVLLICFVKDNFPRVALDFQKEFAVTDSAYEMVQSPGLLSCRIVGLLGLTRDRLRLGCSWLWVVDT